MIRFLLRACFAALGLWIASRIVPGIHIGSWQSLAFCALLLGLINAIVRPIVVFFTFPFTVITLGLFLLVINGAMLGLAAMFFRGIGVDGLWPAILGALVISITSWFGAVVLGGDDRRAERK